MKTWRSLLFGIAAFSFFFRMVQVCGQYSTQSFISIDCGIPEGHSYTDNTNVFYVSDSRYIDTGVNNKIASNYINTTILIQDMTARSFPVGGRNCYTLTPVVMNQKYLLRATFMYGNYDGLQSVKANAFIAFDLYIGVNLWKTVNISDAATEYQVEAITVALADFISVCLINTNSGTPFISELELRPIESVMYPTATESQSIVLSLRLNYGPRTNRQIRYPDDPYDRIWAPYAADADAEAEQWVVISTTSPIKNYANDSFEASSAVLQTAVVPAAVNSTAITFLRWAPDNASAVVPEYFLVFHFAELQLRTGNASRQFGIYVAGSVLWYWPYTPPTLMSGYVYSVADGSTYGSPYYAFSLNATWNSTLPPLINAAEVYTRLHLTGTATDLKDDSFCDSVDAIMAIKAQYHVKKNWMGDPCNPTMYVWDSSRISFVDLSFSGLTGHIYDSFSMLQAIKYLDLSYNNLTGEIPDFLANLSSLLVLNLTGNNFTGPVPDALVKKAGAGLLVLRNQMNLSNNKLDNNTAPCSGISCGNNYTASCGGISCGNTKIIIVVVSVISATLLALAVFTLWIMCRKKQGFGQNVSVTPHVGAIRQQKVDNEESRVHINIERRQFTYLQLENMTNKFAQVIGRGGFGVVYHGYLDDGTEVAVKICSLVSSQGTKQFLAKAKSLTHVYHKNLVSLVGYCQDGLALIYEYLPLGSLHDHLRGKAGVAKALNWEVRLRIALEAAQGLDYLHTGCKIVHRDVKSSNILLSENLEAKISDFGLSKVFGIDANTSLISVCGTPGYMDPESAKSLMLNEKSDVYSFGVVLLEIITGEQPILQGQGKENVHIVKRVSKSLAKGNINAIVDARLRGKYSANSMWKVADLALRCTADASIERPTMAEVVVQLNDSLAMESARARSKNVHGEILNVSQDSAFGFSSVSVGPFAR